MVSVKQKFQYLENGDIDLESWLAKTNAAYPLQNTGIIEKACLLAKESSKGLSTFYGQTCIEQSLEMGEIIESLKLDQEAVAAAIMMSSMRHTKLPIEKVQERLGDGPTKLILGVQQMDAIHNLQNAEKARDQIQIDRMRKLLLAMVSDIRVVLIKLAERTCIMRGIKGISPLERKRIAQETMDIYAPLANRLGIGQLKWELEDIAFHYSDPDTYKKIAKFLAERRTDREERIHLTITQIKDKMHESGIKASVTGRAKHIYSIFSKTKRKNVDYKDIYDSSAVRILVPTIEDCYSALSIVHTMWEHIPEEFDDYITTPKPNGYRSIHTAVVGPDDKNLEIQIRTHTMHEEAERGVAAHWLYKEAKSSHGAYEAKIVFLRQLLDWHRDVATQDEEINPAYDQILTDRVYVFTPTGDILDLQEGATPLDCAYQIHSEVGNHCRGAKINGHIVPLTYKLKTGDQIEILTNPNGTPSRDWLNAEFGYITTSRSRAKVAHWFRQLDLNQHIESGKRILDREFARVGVQINLQKLASHFQLKDEDTLLAALGRGNLRLSQITHLIETDHSQNKDNVIHLANKKQESKGMNIAGITDLLTRIARCCKPIPGDEVVGFITQGRGVSIHKKTCNNVTHLDPTDTKRLLQVNWDNQHIGAYYVDVLIRAHTQDTLLKEVTTLLANAKMDLVNLNSTVNRNNMMMITITVQIKSLPQLTELLGQIHHLKGVIEAKRLSA
ncbi:MAG: bifunctional (p)ppGpp synthetase/guanosine-3',5'-bis(diphosphate) 3'-pyrophosphohydrolase [Gammaproteobacteria bacterium]|nr:bifunctional (p)ppGpp synthetase/guanosine-3',5'-bis(diphosphate) 3'-pyrophosphohydrolase [Gammaproteobacteria bacterium]